MNPLIVGEMPSPTTSWRHPMYPYPPNCSGARLQRFLGVTRAEYIRDFDRCDLIWEYRTPWPTDAAGIAAMAIRMSSPGRLLILCGARVRDSFLPPSQRRDGWFYGVRAHTTANARQVVMLIVPHPSGRNPIWREQGAVERFRTLVETGKRFVADGKLEDQGEVPWVV